MLQICLYWSNDRLHVIATFFFFFLLVTPISMWVCNYRIFASEHVQPLKQEITMLSLWNMYLEANCMTTS